MVRAETYHALKVDKNRCMGCSRCMHVCPTEAIRVRNGKAFIRAERCIDCGECYSGCPVFAISIQQDDFSLINRFKYKVALVPSVFFGQFPSEYSIKEIYGALCELGFDLVFEVEHGVEVLKDATRDIMKKKSEVKPLISSFCPAVVRLIQVKFPSLVDHILRLKTPHDFSALYLRKHLVDQGMRNEDIGIFYFSPCAAKIVAHREPVGEDTPTTNGVINMDFIYNMVFRRLKQRDKKSCVVPEVHAPSPEAILWSLTNGEKNNMEGRALAIDGIHNVIEFLEKLESEEIDGIDFLEVRACKEGCAGGCLCSGNRFLTVENLKKRAEELGKHQEEHPIKLNMQKYKDYLIENAKLEAFHPRSMLKLDDCVSEAMRKMKQVKDVLRILPGIDCGACGAPNCQALAEDIAQGKAKIQHCVFIQKDDILKGKMSAEEAHKLDYEIWGNYDS